MTQVNLELKEGVNSTDLIFQNGVKVEPSIGKMQTQRQSIGYNVPDRLAPFSYFSDEWLPTYAISKNRRNYPPSALGPPDAYVYLQSI